MHWIVEYSRVKLSVQIPPYPIIAFNFMLYSSSFAVQIIRQKAGNLSQYLSPSSQIILECGQGR